MLTKVSIPGRLAKAAADFCSTDSNRGVLQCAVIRRGHLIATNGHVLVKTPLFDDAQAFVTGADAVPDYLDHPDYLVPVSALKDVKVSEHLEVSLELGAVVRVKTKTDEVVATLPGLETPTERQYPNVDQVIPRGPAVARVAFDPAYLIAVGKLAQAFGWENITFDLTDGLVKNGSPKDNASHAVVLRSAHIGPHTTTALLMPKKLIY